MYEGIVLGRGNLVRVCLSSDRCVEFFGASEKLYSNTYSHGRITFSFILLVPNTSKENEEKPPSSLSIAHRIWP